MSEQIKKLLEIIKHGSKEEISEAKKEFEKIWPRCRVNSTPEEFMEQDEYIQAFLSELSAFDDIKEEKNKLAFIDMLKHLLRAAPLREAEYSHLMIDFILTLIQNPSGNIRNAVARKSFELVAGLKLKEEDYSRTKNDKETVEKHREIFGEFVDKIYALMSRYDEPRF